MKMAAASALAGVVTINDLCEDHIIPDALGKNVVPIVAKAVSSASFESCVARRFLEDNAW